MSIPLTKSGQEVVKATAAILDDVQPNILYDPRDLLHKASRRGPTGPHMAAMQHLLAQGILEQAENYMIIRRTL